MSEYRAVMCWTHNACFADGEAVGTVVPLGWKVLQNTVVVGPTSQVAAHISANKPCVVTPVWWET